MKRLLFLYLALAVPAGCATDTEPAPVPVGGVISMHSESALANGAANEMSTRADDAVLTYIFEAWTHDANPRCVLHKTATGIVSEAAIEIQLVPGDYDFLFWADSGKGHYATDNLRQVTATTAYTPAVVSERDAFACARSGVRWTGGNVMSATLVRPLAKLTVQNDAEFVSGGKAVSVLYRNIPTRYDVLTGKTSVPADVSLAFPSTTVGSAVIGEDFLFVPSDEDRSVGLEITVGEDVDAVTKKLDKLPLQPNYKIRVTAAFE